MRITDFFRIDETSAPTHTWTLASHDSGLAPIDALAQYLADKTMLLRCSACPHHYEAWKNRASGGPPLAPTSYEALSKGFVKPLFGLPDTEVPSDHLQGGVAQYLWYFLVLDTSSEEIVRVERPGFAATDHGGDGLVIHRVPPGYLMFRLWEIKKNTGTSPVSSTVNTAYSQLNSRAPEYLARCTSVGQEVSDAELAEFFGKLPDLWIDACKEAAVGVAVAINTEILPATCFTTFGTQFPRFIDPRRLKGMLAAIEDFASFATKVQEAIWRGL